MYRDCRTIFSAENAFFLTLFGVILLHFYTNLSSTLTLYAVLALNLVNLAICNATTSSIIAKFSYLNLVLSNNLFIVHPIIIYVCTAMYIRILFECIVDLSVFYFCCFVRA